MNMLSFLHAKGGQGDKLVVLMDGASSLASYRHFTAFTLASNGSKSGVSNYFILSYRPPKHFSIQNNGKTSHFTKEINNLRFCVSNITTRQTLGVGKIMNPRLGDLLLI